MTRAALLVLAGLVIGPAHAFGADEDATLMKACPSLAAWATSHPHGADADAAADAGRRFAEPALREALASRAAADARARAAIGAAPADAAALEAMLATDAENLAWLKRVVARHGFPTVAQVGRQGVADAWLLAQHADRDTALQLQVLRTLRDRGVAEGVRRQELALLTDRVLLAQGRPQRYGTQFAPDETGNLSMQPVEDPSHLDQRRARAGLMPLALYRCVLRASYMTPPGR